jgi:hypothetical protein
MAKGAEMDNRRFDRIAALAAALVAALSVLYAIAFLGLTPADQRGSDVDEFYRSYLEDPTGARIASTCLLLSGLVVGTTVVALTRRFARNAPAALSWAAIVGVVAGLATAAHGLTSLIGIDELARDYEDGDAATRAAIAVAHSNPSQVDPRGLATFLAAGLVALVLGLAIRRAQPRLGQLGIVLGVDMAVLFLATAIGVGPLVLLTGGLASVILGPIWWVGVARLLWAEPQTAGA